MFESIYVILWSAVLAPCTYFLFQATSYIITLRRRARAIDQLPGSPKHWLWGTLHLFPGPNEAGLKVLRECVVKFPRVYRVWLGNMVRPSAVVHHPDTVKLILKTTEPKPLGLGIYRYGRKWIGDGLLVSSGAKWARNRRLLTPAFHFDILRPYIQVKNRCVETFLDKVGECADQDKSFDFFANMSLLTFDIILKCACSFDNDVQVRGESHPYVQAVCALGDLWLRRALKPWVHFDFLYNLTAEGRLFNKHADYVHSISKDIIQQRRRVLTEQGEMVRTERYLDFLDILLTAKDEDGKGLTDTEIRDEVDTFLFEGHDTTASSISWVLYSLAGNPDCQRLCQQEIDELLDGRDDDSITWDDLSKLKYLTMCIKESMRLHCPVPFIERILTSEMTIDGVTLPTGTVIDIQIYMLHHNPAVWEEPMEFRPDRFLPENIGKIDTYAFVPFSAGPRNCIGQHFAMHEQKVITARILRRFTLELDPDRTVEKKFSVVMKPQNGIYLKAAYRQKYDRHEWHGNETVY